ncbi:4-coumarate-- ligase-like 6, partial [Olea europaea subsp. europaea]
MKKFNADEMVRTIDRYGCACQMITLLQGCGLTESTALGTRDYSTVKFHKYSFIGLLAPNAQAKVVDWVTSSFLPLGSVGEL